MFLMTEKEGKLALKLPKCVCGQVLYLEDL